MASTSIPWPEPGKLTRHAAVLAAIVAQECFVPDPKVVSAFKHAVFPSLRTDNKHPLFSTLKVEGRDVAMYDTNVTPEWALTWSHGIFGMRPKGWTVAHVWPTTKDHHGYTCLANLVLIPEALSSTTDKSGPLTAYLRFHAWTTYSWKPTGAEEPVMPPDYGKVQHLWRTMKRAEGDPPAMVSARLLSLDNRRTRLLRPIMESLQYL